MLYLLNDALKRYLERVLCLKMVDEIHNVLLCCKQQVESPNTCSDQVPHQHQTSPCCYFRQIKNSASEIRFFVSDELSQGLKGETNKTHDDLYIVNSLFVFVLNIKICFKVNELTVAIQYYM